MTNFSPGQQGSRASIKLTLEERLILEETVRRGLTLPKPVVSPFRDEWDFLQRAVFTKDEASGKIRRFPDWEYLKYLTLRRRELYWNPPVHAFPKSRRMMVTWWMIALYLYDTMTQANHANFIGSEKLTKSAYLLGPHRLEHIYHNIPADVWPDKPTLRFTDKRGEGWETISCPQTGSIIIAMAQGAEELQQYTASNIFLDEFARWRAARDSWRSIVPCIQGENGRGGHIDVVSTPELGAFMYDLIYDVDRKTWDVSTLEWAA